MWIDRDVLSCPPAQTLSFLEGRAAAVSFRVLALFLPSSASQQALRALSPLRIGDRLEVFAYSIWLFPAAAPFPLCSRSRLCLSEIKP